MKLEIEEIENGYLVLWYFGLLTYGKTSFKTKKGAIDYSKKMLDKYGKEYDE